MDVTLRYSEYATKAIQTIFGEDVISRVYVEEERARVLDCKDEYLRWDACFMVALLVNGRRVFMHNSEWGSFATYKEKNGWHSYKLKD
jgi:hypothetical protein